MTERNELLAGLEFYGIIPSEEIIMECLTICIKYNIRPQDFVDDWTAYSIGKSAGYPLNEENLKAMERKEYKKRQVNTVTKVAPSTNYSSNDTQTDDLVTTYATGTPKRLGSAQAKKDVTNSPKNNNPKLNYPTSQLESIPTVGYAERKDSGDELLTFGRDDFVKGVNYKRQNNDNTEVNISIADQPDTHLKTNTKYMYEPLISMSESLNYMSDYIAHSIVKKYNLSSVSDDHKCILYGRVRFPLPKEGFQTGSVLLNLSNELSAHGKSVILNFQKVGAFSLFPGQTIVVWGHYLQLLSKKGKINEEERKREMIFVVHRIYTDARQELPEIGPSFTKPLEIVAAAGPFTLQENLQYEPLQDLLKYVILHKPHVLILVGPFNDSKERFDCEDITDTYEGFFETLINSIMTPLQDLNTQVILVASSKDLHHHVVYPTPPYSPHFQTKYPNLHLLPDPCMVDINGIILGVTSADVLMHLSSRERTGGRVEDRMGRICKYILDQQCFYPLYPPDKSMSIDYGSLEQYATMDITPHIMILPSNLKHFIKDIDDCLVINPERLSKYNSGGTFVRMHVDIYALNSITKTVACQILKV